MDTTGFEAALVLAGEITLTWNGAAWSFVAGDVFTRSTRASRHRASARAPPDQVANPLGPRRLRVRTAGVHRGGHRRAGAHHRVDPRVDRVEARRRRGHDLATGDGAAADHLRQLDRVEAPELGGYRAASSA